MCDYSLYTTPNRLAQEGEALVLHRFPSGSLGFAASADLENICRSSEVKPARLWTRIRNYFALETAPAIPAVCVPPGARLLLEDLPQRVQKRWGTGTCEVAVFTEISNHSFSYRDALLFPSGRRALLQELPEGMHATVLSLTPEPVFEPVLRRARVA